MTEEQEIVRKALLVYIDAVRKNVEKATWVEGDWNIHQPIRAMGQYRFEGTNRYHYKMEVKLVLPETKP